MMEKKYNEQIRPTIFFFAGLKLLLRGLTKVNHYNHSDVVLNHLSLL